MKESSNHKSSMQIMGVIQVTFADPLKLDVLVKFNQFKEQFLILTL